MFVEPNDKGAYCAHRSSRDVDVFMDIDAFMDMPQLKVTQIWDMRLNGYSGYWSLKALKSVTATLYKLRMPDQPNIDQYEAVDRAVVDTLAAQRAFVGKTHVVLHLLPTSALNSQLEYTHMIRSMQAHNKKI